MAHQLENSDQVLTSTHPSARCIGSTCTIHNMSDHPLRSYEQHWNGGFMERIAPDGNVFLDPDDPSRQERPNAARCLECDVLLYSRHRHDYRTCACGNLMVDGGADYIRRGFRDLSKIQEVEYWPVPAGFNPPVEEEG